MRAFGWIAVLCASSVTIASTIVPHTLIERARRSDRVAVVQVLGQRVERSGSPARPTLKTFTRVAVGDELRGSGPRELTIVQLGGRDGPWELHVPGDASFVVGETDLVFLRCQGERCALVALGEGRLPLVNGELFVRDLFTNQVVKRSLASVMTELKAADR
jgi:hypothetical protein